MGKEKIERVCIDDFALKRRFRYGTIMVDIDTRRIVDLLESREPEDVAKWLATFPNIQIVSRDGSLQYAAAIRKAHPDALHVSDRFHLLKNLTEGAKQHISKTVSANFRIPAVGKETSMDGGYWEKPVEQKADIRVRKHIANTEKKRAAVEQARSLLAQGVSICVVAREMGINAVTIKKYVQADFDSENKLYGSKLPGKLNPYTDTIDALLRKGHRFKEIEAVIRGDGYKGSASVIRKYAARKRRLMQAANTVTPANTELIERRWVTKLLYQPIEKTKGITESQVERVVKEYPIIGNLYALVRSFKAMMFAKHVNALDAWMGTALQLNIDEVNSFVRGIAQDMDAVKNAIRFEYNNGLAEGSVHKLKVIKRIMYGRCSFNLLRNKVLLKEACSRFN